MLVTCTNARPSPDKAGLLLQDWKRVTQSNSPYLTVLLCCFVIRMLSDTIETLVDGRCKVYPPRLFPVVFLSFIHHMRLDQLKKNCLLPKAVQIQVKQGARLTN